MEEAEVKDWMKAGRSKTYFVFFGAQPFVIKLGEMDDQTNGHTEWPKTI